MKKIMLVLAIVGVIVGCSRDDETLKKETIVEVVIPKEETLIPLEIGEIEVVKIIRVEVKKISKEKQKIKSTPKPIVDEKLEETLMIERSEDKIVDRDIDKIVDKDVDKQIAKVEIETKVIESEPVKEETSKKNIYGILGAILVAVAAVFVFKKK